VTHEGSDHLTAEPVFCLLYFLGPSSLLFPPPPPTKSSFFYLNFILHVTALPVLLLCGYRWRLRRRSAKREGTCELSGEVLVLFLFFYLLFTPLRFLPIILLLSRFRSFNSPLHRVSVSVCVCVCALSVLFFRDPVSSVTHVWRRGGWHTYFSSQRHRR
jgi:hypothetical protein